MERPISSLTRALIDLAILSAAYFGAYALRFDGVPPLQDVKRLMFTWPYVVSLELLVLYLFAIPYFVWRYVSLRETQRVLVATGVTTAIFLALRFGSVPLMRYFEHFEYLIIPIGVIFANSTFMFLGVVGARVLRRIHTERRQSHHLRSDVPRVPTLLLGAGQAGVLVAKEIEGRPDLPIRLVGFLDDNPAKLGTIVHGVRVLGSTVDVKEIVRTTGAKQAIVTIANASGAEIRTIQRRCQAAGVPVKVVPGVYELLGEKVNLTRIRDVSIEDLLGRKAVTLDVDLVSRFIRGRRVLVTGAGGSIGSELCRQVALFNPTRLVLVEQSEFALFSIHQELSKNFPDLDLTAVICDVCDSERVEVIFDREAPEVVFHAAAHKHVPMMEWNPGEAIKNNVFGTRVVADAAARHEASAFVLISTDKAVNPTSIMGATKRAAEMYVQALSERSPATKFVAVRFGNVLGSTGSVVPIFQAQIAAGGPVTVTHPDMKRYFMTIPEASQLVIQAAAMGEGGEIFMLDMGEQVRIADLAEELIRLSGLEPKTDIEIVYSGVRPGEKLEEELCFDAERMARTRHDKIFIGRLRRCDLDEVARALQTLQHVINSCSRDEVRMALRQLVVEMREPTAERKPLPEPRDVVAPESIVPERGLTPAAAS